MRSLCVAYEVVGEEATQFVHELAENQRGISLAYLHHLDSLKTGNSYTNEQHIKLKDHVDVRRGEGRDREGGRERGRSLSYSLFLFSLQAILQDLNL